jgi:hypothetical protein
VKCRTGADVLLLEKSDFETILIRDFGLAVLKAIRGMFYA